LPLFSASISIAIMSVSSSENGRDKLKRSASAF
jgi:hypothetical protein